MTSLQPDNNIFFTMKHKFRKSLCKNQIEHMTRRFDHTLPYPLTPNTNKYEPKDELLKSIHRHWIYSGVWGPKWCRALAHWGRIRGRGFYSTDCLYRWLPTSIGVSIGQILDWEWRLIPDSQLLQWQVAGDPRARPWALLPLGDVGRSTKWRK